MKLIAILAAAALSAGAATSANAVTNLITNGDFSAGLSGWSETNSCCYFTDQNGFHEGAVDSNGMLSQTFGDPAGVDLTLTFDYTGDAGYQYVSFNGVTVAGSYVANPSSTQSYRFDLGPGHGSDTLVFNGQNDPSYNTLDNVSVSVPEPATWALMLVGVGGLGANLRRRRDVAVATA